MQKLNRDNFIKALRNGHGRAFMHIQQYGDAGIEFDLMDATLHAWCYDPQMDGVRGKWMFDMLRYTKNPEIYDSAVLDAYMKTEHVHDISQQTDFLVCLAKAGQSEAREKIYQKHKFKPDIFLVAPDLLRMDGLPGLLYLADFYGQRMLDGDEFDFGYLTGLAAEHFGVAKVEETLRAAAADNKAIHAAIECTIKDYGALCEYTHPVKRAEKPKLTFPEFLENMMLEKSRGYFFRFGRECLTQDDSVKLLHLLQHEVDPEKILRYLWCFHHRAMPDIIPEIFIYAESADQRIASAAIRSLGKIKSETVRQFAFSLLEKGRIEALNILEVNHQVGDLLRVQPYLDLITDNEDMHRGLNAFRDIACISSKAEALPAFLYIYEKSPCSYCRHVALEELYEMSAIPHQIAEEIVFDSFDETRELASKL